MAHDPEKYRRSLACAIQHLENAAANLPDGQGLDSMAREEVPTVIDSVQQLWLMSAARHNVTGACPGPERQQYL